MENLMGLKKIVSLDSGAEYFGFIASKNFREKGEPAETSLFIHRISDGSLMNSVVAEKGTSLEVLSFSPDGARFAFLEEAGKKQNLVIGKIGESTDEKVELPGTCSQVGWSGPSLLVLMKDPLEPERKLEIEKGNDGMFFEEDVQFTSLYKYDPGYGFSRLTHDLQIWEYCAGSGAIALVASDSPGEDAWYDSKLYLLDLESGKCTLSYDPAPRTLTRPAISPDGKMVAFLESHWSDRGVTAGDVILYSLGTGKALNITDGLPRSFTDITWYGNNSISALFKESSEFGIANYSSSWEDMWKSTGNVQPNFAPSFSFNGSRYFLAFSSPSEPGEICSVNLKGNFSRLTDMNSQYRELQPSPYEVLEWKSTDGKLVYGLLRCRNPKDPLVVYIHGGPTSSSTLDFMDNSTVLLDEGFSVFLPNYRGSTGFGRKYAESNIGDMGGGDMDDVLSGIEFLKSTGKVTANNYFITGGSYGGYLTNLAITRTGIFSAAVGLFGMSDWLSFHGTTGITAWDTLYYRNSVYNPESGHWKFDPLKSSGSIDTPLLLMHGVNDPLVPVGQSYEFYRKLKEGGKIVRFLVFQREGHGFSEKYHKLAMMEETVKWFKKYLG